MLNPLANLLRHLYHADCSDEATNEASRLTSHRTGDDDMAQTAAQKAAATRAANAKAQAEASTDEGSGTDEGEGGDTSTDTSRGGARTMPTYGLGSFTDELPEDLDLRSESRRGMYMGPLSDIVSAEDNWGKWADIATFYSKDGAKNAEKNFVDGKRDMPSGEWEFKAIRVKAEDQDHGKSPVWSKLYARYMGE